MESRGASARSAWRPRGANFSTMGPTESERVGGTREREREWWMMGASVGRSDGEEGVGGVVLPAEAQEEWNRVQGSLASVFLRVEAKPPPICTSPSAA